MNNITKISEFIWIVVVWLLIGVGLFLRVFRGDQYPISQNDDGLFHAWAGNSILDDWKNPTSLTIFEKDNPNLIWRSQYMPLEPKMEFGFRLTDKWFDQPFLATVLIALPARILGFNGFEQVPQILVRLPVFVAAVFSLFLTYKLGEELYNKRVGLLALVVLVFWPLATWSQRQSYLENFITPLLLLSLLGVWRYKKQQSRNNLLMVVAAGILSGWTKIIGFSVPLISAFWLKSYGFGRAAWWVILAGLGAFGIYILYGGFVGGDSFWSTILNQSGRGAYFTSTFHVLTHPETLHGVVNDGWWFLGFFALIWAGFNKSEKVNYVGMSGLFWLITMFVTSGIENTSPWYRYPLFPVMAVALGVVFNKVWERKNLIWPVLVYMLGMTGWEMAGYSISASFVRLGLVVVLVMFGLEFVVTSKKLSLIRRVGLVVLLLVSVIGNVLAIYKVPLRYCQSGNCLMPDKVIVESK